MKSNYPKSFKKLSDCQVENNKDLINQIITAFDPQRGFSKFHGTLIACAIAAVALEAIINPLIKSNKTKKDVPTTNNKLS